MIRGGGGSTEPPFLFPRPGYSRGMSEETQENAADPDAGQDGGDAAETARAEEEAVEEAKKEMSELEEGDPPERLEDWPGGKAKYLTYGGPDGGESYDDGATSKLGPSSLRHHEDGRAAACRDHDAGHEGEQARRDADQQPDDQADQHLGFACEFQEANGMLLSAARAQLGWAEALAARGDAVGAREHAASALDLSREHGYGLFERRAAALIETQSAAEADRH